MVARSDHFHQRRQHLGNSQKLANCAVGIRAVNLALVLVRVIMPTVGVRVAMMGRMMAMKVVATRKQVQTIAQERNGSKNRYNKWGGESPKETHKKGRYYA